MKEIYKLKDLDNLVIDIKEISMIFLKGDLGAGKTTFSKHILNNLLLVKKQITSPTYTYYNKYKGIINNKKVTIYHFDLYRLSSYDEFVSIGGEEIFDNNTGIILVEWPEIVEKYYKADIKIYLKDINKNNKREVEIL